MQHILRTLRSLIETYFIINGDISSSVQQRFDDRYMFVLCSPDDRRPAPAVRKATNVRIRVSGVFTHVNLLVAWSYSPH